VVVEGATGGNPGEEGSGNLLEGGKECEGGGVE